MVEFVQAVSFIQNMMKEPWAQQVMGIMGVPCSTFSTSPSVAAPAPATVPAKPPGDKSSELDDAKNGKPASSKPKAPEASTPSTPAAPPAEPAPEAEAVPEPEPSVPETPEPPKEINSSTHRAAHARLARKMNGMKEAECPQMQKLWSGSRKDTSFNHIWRPILIVIF